MKFEEAKPITRGYRNLEYVEKGWLKISAYGIYFGEPVLEAIGANPNIMLYVDKHNKLLKLTNADTNGWKPRRIASKTTKYYVIRANKSPLLQNLPYGLYYPTGGGVYSFDIQNNH